MSPAKSHAHESIAGPSSIARRSVGTELPPYQPPSFPLNLAARQALAELSRKYSTDRIDAKLKTAAINLHEGAGDINERLREINLNHQTRLKRKAKETAEDGDKDEEDDNEEAEYLQQTRTRIEKMTGAMEKSIRKVIDGHAHIDAIDVALKHTKDKATTSASAIQATQMSTQRSMRGTNPDDSDDDGPTQTNAPPPSLTPAFETTLWSRKDRYLATSHHARYAAHNNYINFKRVVHDAQHPDENVPIPNSSTWFSVAEGAPQPGETAAGDDDSDDDIAIAGAKTSTKCPITFLEFKEPVTSIKCPHSYERYAIEDMINRVRPPAPARRGNPAVPPGWRATVTCPVAGCDHILGKDDVRPDPVLVRRIKRIQRAMEMGGVEGGDKEGGDEVERIESGDSEGDDGFDDVDARAKTPARGKTLAQVARVKREMASRRGTGRTVVEDIEDD